MIEAENSHICKALVVRRHDCLESSDLEENNNIIVHFSLLLMNNRSSNSNSTN